MILKHSDEQASNDLTVLASLMEETRDHRIRDLIHDEMKKIRSGLHGEKQVAFFLNHAYQDDKDVIVLHDIRLVLDDQTTAEPLVAQIDHVVITRDRAIYLLETKGMLGGVIRDEKGDWYRLYGGRRHMKKMACPLAQGDRHCRVVSRMMAGSCANSVRPVMIVMDTTEVKASKGENEDFHIVSADRFPEWLKLRLINDPSIYSILDNNRQGMLNDDEMRGLAFRFIQAHTPKMFDWRGRFGMKQHSIVDDKPIEPGTNDRKTSAVRKTPTRQEMIYERYAMRKLDGTQYNIPGGTVIINRHDDDMRTVMAEGPDDVRRFVSRLCLTIVTQEEWNPLGRFWLMTHDQYVKFVDALKGRTETPEPKIAGVPDTLPSAEGASILRSVRTSRGMPLFEFRTDDGLIRVIRLPEENYAIRPDPSEMNDERIEAVCTENNVGWYNESKRNWMIPHEPPELIERVCRAIKAFQHPLAQRRESVST